MALDVMCSDLHDYLSKHLWTCVSTSPQLPKIGTLSSIHFRCTWNQSPNHPLPGDMFHPSPTSFPCRIDPADVFSPHIGHPVTSRTWHRGSWPSWDSTRNLGIIGAGRCWKVLEGAGRGWKGLEGAGRGWKGLEGAGRCWKVLEGAGRWR